MGPAHVPALVAALVVGLPGPLAAADDCPPGDWFCEPAPPGGPAPAPEGAPLDGAPPPPGPAPPPVADADEEEQVLIDVENVQPAKKRRRDREWGVNLHAALGVMGDDSAKSLDAGMNGLGAALRYRLLPFLAFEGSVDVVWGTDYRGFGRVETALLANAMLFANPRSPVQLYGVAGFGLSTASVDGSYLSGTLLQDDVEQRYGYFGGQLGAGLEARITRHLALGGDLVGFIRTRIDSDASDEPEYVDAGTRRTTNSSGGALIRLGATVYW
ncbi:MAG TPA: outer membrane beta-barrel protein [Polyangiaceae bacterium]